MTNRFFCFFLWACLFIVAPTVKAQIVINEVSSANSSLLPDEKDEFEDWIELYNTGATPVNLLNYILLREEDKDNQWKFPAVTIKPYSYLTVFASGKDHKPIIDHWETAVAAHDVWRYKLGTAEPDSNWRETSYNDTAWLQGIGGFGFGDNDDSTVIPQPATSLYLRKSFQVADTAEVSLAIFSIDYDDGFVAYLNGVEIARANMNDLIPAFNATAGLYHEAQLYQGNNSDKFILRKDDLKSSLRTGTSVLTIQVHNADTASDDLTVIADLRLGISNGIITNPIYPSILSGLHTDFNLSSAGQILSLYNSSGNKVDEITVRGMQPDYSIGRSPDGGSNVCLFGIPTPSTSNNTAVCATGYEPVPVFGLSAGFYNGSQQLSITSANNSVIRYTINGNTPTLSSTVYSSPIIIDSSVVIKARSFSTTGLLPSEVVTNTYFINENITLPVISLSTDSENLWDYNKGMYVTGPGAGPNIPYEGANYWQDWEKPGHVEYFDGSGNQGFELNSGLRIFGNFTRSFTQKGFRVVAKDNYGTPVVNYKLFSGRNYTEFKNFNIRNAGNDWNIVHFRDAFMHRAAKSTHVDIMEAEHCVTFLNGKYWGVYEIRERQDKNYLAQLHNVDPDKIDLLEYNGDVIEGENHDFLNTTSFIANNDMSVEANYDSVNKLIDLENFCDYFITETYYDNQDWIISNDPLAKPTDVNNIKFWRTNNPTGKWRYILWDVDVAMGLFTLASDNNLQRTISGQNVHSVMLRQLLQHTGFKNYFINRYADLMNTIFLPSKLNECAAAMRNEIAPEMPRQLAKWGGTFPNQYGFGSSHDMASWNNALNVMKFFIDHRMPYARNYLQSQFNLTKQVDVTLDVYPAGAGKIKINTITPDSLPWTGVYYDGVPVTATAIPNAGYKFVAWKGTTNIPTDIRNVSVTANIATDDTLTAVFELLELNVSVTPNPFTDQLNITYELPSASQTSLQLYSVSGQLMEEFIAANKVEPAGVHTINFNSGKLEHGTYVLKFTTGNYSKTMKLVKAGK